MSTEMWAIAADDILVPAVDDEVNSAQMGRPTEQAFADLSRDVKDLNGRVQVLEERPTSWVEKNPTTAWLLGLGITAAVGLLAVFAGLLPLLEDHLDLQIKKEVESNLEVPKQEITSIYTQIGTINGELNLVIPLVVNQSKKDISDAAKLTGPEFRTKLPELGAALSVASQQRVAIDQLTLQDISRKVVETVSTEAYPQPVAWNTFIELIHYYSYLNAAKDPHYNSEAAGVSSPPIQRGGITSSIEDLTLVGGTFVLEEHNWKNVVFQNATIRYGGGRAVLDNVKFENCRFEMSISKPAIELGKQMLASNAVTFNHPS